MPVDARKRHGESSDAIGGVAICLFAGAYIQSELQVGVQLQIAAKEGHIDVSLPAAEEAFQACPWLPDCRSLNNSAAGG
ncbi:unnamed protein product [Effrenium voratum]|nr:unnamed protein product [Effrenium voratum]